MQIIKLNVKLQSKQMKVFVDMNPQQQLTVLSFLKRFVDVCGINNVNAEDFQLYDGDFILPHNLPAFWISDKKTYSVIQTIKEKKRVIEHKKVSKNNNQIIKKNQKIVQKSESSSDQSIQSSVSVSSSDFKKFKKQKSLKKVHKNQMKVKQVPKIPEIPQIPQRPINALATQINAAYALRSLKKNQQNAQRIKKRLKQSQQSSDSSSETPSNHKQKITKIVQKINEKTKTNQIERKKQQPTPQLQKPIITNSLKVPLSVRKNKVNIKASTNQSQVSSKQNNEVKPVEQSGVDKNKQQLTFKEYQELKWIAISKNLLTSWKEKNGEEDIVAVGNQIRFKIMELDEEKFTPVTSGWITGYVTGIETNKDETNISFKRVTKEQRSNQSEQSIQNYTIPFHNMQQLQINKNSFNDKQNMALVVPVANKQKQSSSKKIVNEPKPKVASLKKQQKQQKLKQQSIQQYICGQISYYFSDKNYATDLFMQMHANSDPNKFINFKLMLNFPKIKKVLKDEQTLWGYLANDQRYANRNYELDLQRKMIKKKGL